MSKQQTWVLNFPPGFIPEDVRWRVDLPAGDMRILQCELDEHGRTWMRRNAVPLEYILEHIDDLVEADAQLRWGWTWLPIRAHVKRFTEYTTDREIDIGGRR